MNTSPTNDTIAQLRSELFKTLRGLTDKECPMDIERAKAVSDVAQTIINTAKVEIDHMKVAGGKGTGFILDDKSADEVVTSRPGVTVTRHVLRG